MSVWSDQFRTMALQSHGCFRLCSCEIRSGEDLEGHVTKVKVVKHLPSEFKEVVELKGAGNIIFGDSRSEPVRR